MVIQRMCQVGNGPIAIVCLLVTTLPFYSLSFEEFYTGVLVMPAFTGPDDAALCVFVFSLITAGYGAQELWGTDLDIFGYGVRTGHLLCLALLASFGLNNVNVMQNLWHREPE